MIKKQYANQSRLLRHVRVRKTVVGTPERPRLSVFRSANDIYVQVIDDSHSRTIVAASSRDKDLASAPADALDAFEAQAASGEATPGEEGVGNGASEQHGKALPKALKGLTANRRVRQAFQVGQLIARRAKAAGVNQVVFDRGGYIYHG
ncbi:MAG TPA: 50S ribosomal protein L18, partial [Ktedonobacterales bacterium]|nr:50S ribosomal protein L18 [Ktedonobacterales bacterium]